MALLGLNAEALGIAVFFVAVSGAVVVAFTVHTRLLASRVQLERRERRREQAAQLAAMRPQPHLARPAATTSIAAQLRPSPKGEEVSSKKAA